MAERFPRQAAYREATPPTHETDTAQKPRRIYIDCTSTYTTGLNTGIQRVVRGLVERERAISQHAGIPCIPVIAFRGRYWPFSEKQRAWVQDILTGSARSRKAARGRFGRFERAVSALKERLHMPPGITTVSLNIVREAGSRMWWHQQSTTLLFAFRRLGVRPILPMAQDLLFIPDTFWGEYGQLAAAERLAAAGCAIVPVIHDIGPLTHPEYFPDFNARLFARGLVRMLGISRGVLTVSRTAMSDVGHYCSQQGFGHIPLEYAYSGADIAQPSQGQTTSVRPGIVANCQARPFLMVGTVEPRKGYHTALDAYDQYRQSGGKRPLVIIGRLGWKERDIVARMQDVALSSGSIVFYSDASDTELAALYEHARALIFASHYEGFGLPLVEAMHHGLPVIASDIPVFREVGEGYPAYFRVGDTQDLCRALLEHDQAGVKDARPRRAWPTWDDAAPVYIDKALTLYAAAF